MYRLTLVKSWNSEELQNYADLVSLGKPDFIEVKVNQKTQFNQLSRNEPISERVCAPGAKRGKIHFCCLRFLF